MGSAKEVEEFAETLRGLKNRSGRSYGSLATRLHVSTSTLHRYCNGDAVPAEYAPVERFARLCGATPEELIALHRRWILADAARRRAAADRRGGATGAADADASRSASGREARGRAATERHETARTGTDGGRAEGTSGTRPRPSVPTPADGPHHAADATRQGGPGRPETGWAQPRSTDPGEGDAHPTAGADGPKPHPDAAATGPDRSAPGPDEAGRAAARGEMARRAADAASDVPHETAPTPERPGPLGSVSGQAVAGRAGARTRLRSVPADGGGAAGRDTRTRRPGRPGRTRPWALMAGAAAVVVLAVTAVEVRSPGETRHHHTAAPPRATASGSAPAGGPTARAHLDKQETGGGQKSGAPHVKRRHRDGPADGSPSAGTSGGPDGGPGTTTRVPLTLSTRSHVWENGCDHRYLINRPATQVAPPPTEQDAPAWAAAHGAVHGGTTNVEVTVQGRASSAVVLRALHVRVVGRRTPLAWSSFAMENGCGGSLTPRAFSVDLDASRPQAHPTDGNDAGHAIPAVRFPYRVSASDPEVLLVNARASGCDCGWYLELDWSSGGREGTVRIDDHGTPFRTSGVKGRPEYGYDYNEGVWRENS